MLVPIEAWVPCGLAAGAVWAGLSPSPRVSTWPQMATFLPALALSAEIWAGVGWGGGLGGEPLAL